MRYVYTTLATCLTFTACADNPPTAVRELSPSVAASIVPLDRYGIGAGGRGNACRTAEYRQFDFWLGNWDLNPSGTVGSVISSTLDGCAVLENYFGGSGRSLNAYDDATRTWNQFYVSSSGGVLMLRGGFRSDSMILSEQQGPVNDVWTWTRLPDGSVKQHEQRFLNGLILPGFVGTYTARTTTPSFPAPPVTTCARPGSREMDFLLGTWDVYEGQAAGEGAAQGTLVVSSGAGGCVLEESLTGHAGFAALSFAAFHPQVQRWFRAYMDTDGRYIRLNGSFDGTRMIMTGNRIGANGGLVVVRVTWEPNGTGRVLQRWEFSLDGGATFDSEKEYTFVKR